MRWLQRALLVTAVLLLGYCGYALADTWTFQNRESHRFEELLRAPASPNELPADAAGGLVGRIEVPRLGVSAFVMEGDDAGTLRRAAGHIPGTALPGKPGNVGISAHRDTFFRPLRNIQRDDIITVTTLQSQYRYRVVSTKIVTPDDVAVLKPGSGQDLTLVTCYPFYFVGPAPDRFIVSAERIF